MELSALPEAEAPRPAVALPSAQAAMGTAARGAPPPDLERLRAPRGNWLWRFWTGASRAHLRCEACRAALKPDGLPAGGRARCGSCGSVFRVPLDPCAPEPDGACAPGPLETPSLETPAASRTARGSGIPKRIGPYVLEEEIARGGTAMVFRGRHETLGKPVAVKILLPGMDSSEEMGRRLLREALALARFRHPHIVPVLDAGEAPPGIHYLIMEFVEGEDLARRLGREGPLGWRAALAILAQVLDAIDFAHAQGVIHRDLKPANVLLDADGHARLVDFGLARDESAGSRLTRTGVALGTPAYMPPEQARGEREKIGRPVDIYSAGAVLYEALTGRAPFQGQTLMEVLYRVVQEDPKPLRALAPGVPGEVEAICQKAMRKDPQERYVSAYQMLVDVRACLAGEVPPVAWAGRGALPRRVLRRVGLKGWQAAGLLVAALVLLGWAGAALDARRKVRRAVQDAALALKDGRYEEAERRYVEALTLDGKDEEAYAGHRQAQALRQAGERERLEAERRKVQDEQKRKEQAFRLLQNLPGLSPEDIRKALDSVGELLSNPLGSQERPPAGPASRGMGLPEVRVESRPPGAALAIVPAAGGPAAFEGTAPAQVRLPPGVYLVKYRLAGRAEAEALLSVPSHDTGPRTVLLDSAGLSVHP